MSAHRPIAFSLALFLATASLAFAQIKAHSQHSKSSSQVISWEPPAFPGLELMDARSTVPRLMVTSFSLRGMKVVLEETPLRKVQARFGGRIGYSGDAGDALDWLCLSGASRAHRWVLWLESAELDGGAVGSFQWLRISKSARVDRRCGRIEDSADAVILPGGLELGMNAQNLLKRLGKPTAARGGTLLYLHEHQSKIRNIPYTTDNVVVMIQSKGAVRQIAVSQTTTD